MTQQPLSPAAQAVLDAIRAASPAPADEIAAVTLKAIAGRVVPLGGYIERSTVRAELLAIAAELEGGTSTSSTH